MPPENASAYRALRSSLGPASRGALAGLLGTIPDGLALLHARPAHSVAPCLGALRTVAAVYGALGVLLSLSFATTLALAGPWAIDLLARLRALLSFSASDDERRFTAAAVAAAGALGGFSITALRLFPWIPANLGTPNS